MPRAIGSQSNAIGKLGDSVPSLGQQSWFIDTAGFLITDQTTTATASLVERLNGQIVVRTRSIVGNVGAGSASTALRGNTAISGKVYWEYRVASVSNNVRAGVGNTSSTGSTIYGESTNEVMFDGTTWRTNGTNSSAVTSLAAGDVLMFAADGATGEVWIGANNSWYNSGDPLAGTGEVATISGTLYPFVYTNGALGVFVIATELLYAPPSGFVGL
jgi:hypothetical protein